MSTTVQVLFGSVIIVAGAGLLAYTVKCVVDRQNQQLLKDRADTRLQAMLKAGDLLQQFADDPSLPEPQREAASRLAQDYPKGDQLRVFAQYLGDQLDLNKLR